MHNALLEYYLDQAEVFLADDGVMYHFTEICGHPLQRSSHTGIETDLPYTSDDEYVKTRPGITYCQYIAETAYDSPAKTLRMKTILFLQGSPFYDLVEAEKRLQGIDKLFYEKAIVYGRVSTARSDRRIVFHVLTCVYRHSSNATRKRYNCWQSACVIRYRQRHTAHKVEW